MDLDELEQRVRRHVEVLAGAPRPPGSPAHSRAALYIRSHFQHAGFAGVDEVLEEEGIVCRNLETRTLPDHSSLPLVIVGAHYDTVPGSPGADDNASAVAALLELASFLHPYLQQAPDQLRARLQLIAYDLDEYGLVGSWWHARELKRRGEALRGMVSLEMLGYADRRPHSQQLPPILQGRYPDTADFIGVVGNQDSLALVETVTAAMQTVAGLPVQSLAVPGDGRLISETRLSDHSSFWDQGYPALMITDTSFFRNPHYHQASDTPDTLDYPFLARVTAGVCRAVLQLLR